MTFNHLAVGTITTAMECLYAIHNGVGVGVRLDRLKYSLSCSTSLSLSILSALLQSKYRAMLAPESWQGRPTPLSVNSITQQTSFMDRCHSKNGNSSCSGNGKQHSHGPDTMAGPNDIVMLFGTPTPTPAQYSNIVADVAPPFRPGDG